MKADFEYVCSVCGERHTGIPDLAYDAPFYYAILSEEERKQRAILTPDHCIIDNEEYFVRGVLEVPVRGFDQSFRWGAWVSASEKSFRRYEDFEENTERDVSDEPLFYGWLSNDIAPYEDTLSLKIAVLPRPYPDRPFFELEPTDHPLALDQRCGIEPAKLQKLIEDAVHDT